MDYNVKISNKEYIKRLESSNLERIQRIQRLSKNEDWPALMELLSIECLENENPYVPGMPSDHTHFRAGCQQPLLKLKSILKVNITELTKERN